MSEPSWFNTNENRAYPFIAGVDGPPTAAIVDAGFMPGAKSRFVTGIHTVTLIRIRRHGTFFYFDFASDAPELYGYNLTFSRQISDGDFVFESVDSGTSGLSATSESDNGPNGYCDEPLWSGFLVTGRMAALEALLPGDDDVAYDLGVPIEPALIQNLSATFVTKIGVVNEDRTRSTLSETCETITPASPPDAIFVNSNCVIGRVIFTAGFNANVRQSKQDNSITLGAAVGDGAGEPCDTIRLYPGETPPDGSTLLEGGLRCNETIRSINGLAGPLISLTAGNGVTVTASPATHTISINVDMQGLALCFDTISARSESC